jgi:hypothetical protein
MLATGLDEYERAGRRQPLSREDIVVRFARSGSDVSEGVGVTLA